MQVAAKVVKEKASGFACGAGVWVKAIAGLDEVQVEDCLYLVVKKSLYHAGYHSKAC